MRFAHPKMLWLLAVTLPLLALFLYWSWRKRQYLISQFVRSRLLAHLTVGLSRPIQKARMFLIVVAVGFVIVTLAEPQWGFAWEEAHQRGLDIVLAVDTSRSMLAEDVAPNRLQRARLAVFDLLRQAKHDRLGLVAFSGTAFLQCPLTLDDEAFRQSVNQLDVGIIPQGGTALAEAIDVAQSAFKDEAENHHVIILLTDGEDHDSGAVEAANKAARAGIRIFTVGIGTPNGELLRQRDEQGNLAYIKDDEGNVVKSRLNETLLTQIATAANGFYLPMIGVRTMEVLYQRGLAPLPKGETSTKLVRQFQERYQWPLAIAILLLIIELFLPDRKRVKKTEAIVQAGNPELRKMVALFFLVCVAETASASPSAALRKYESGQYKDAYQEYSRLLEKRPDDLRLQYNAGTAAYQAKKYEEAVKHFSAASTTPQLDLQEHAYYNLGNSLYRSGEEDADMQKKMGEWEQAAKQFESALKLDPKDRDASYNLDYVKKKIEELKEQQKQQQQQQQQNKPDDQKDQKDDQKDKSKQDKQDKDSKKDQSQDQKQAQNQPQPKDQKPDEQSKKDQAKKAPQPKEDQANANDSSQPKPGEKQGQSETNDVNSATAAQLGQMTPEQAKQLLEAQKNEEKALIFLPPDKAKPTRRVFKDW